MLTGAARPLLDRWFESEQLKATQEYIGQLQKSGVVKKPIVTEVAPLKAFFKAEDYHQDYLASHTDQPYIVYNDLPKLERLKRQYPELYHK